MFPELFEEDASASNTPQPTKEPTKGSRWRYQGRLKRFLEDGRAWPRLRHHAFWVAHNCIAHPAMGLHFSQTTVELHELTSVWLNKEPIRGTGRSSDTFPTLKNLGWIRLYTRHLVIAMPNVERRLPWFIHNCIAHPLIGLLPCRATFAFHDKSAVWTEIKNYV